jgi:hypothetical protein
MKIVLLFTMAFSVNLLIAANLVYDAAIEKVISNPSSQNIPELGGYLRGVAHYTQSSARSEYYFKIQKTLLSVPDHAKYFTDKLAEARSKTEKPWLDDNYSRVHSETVQTLIHLPSPETIWALGMILDSGQDQWTKEKLIEIAFEQRSKEVLGLPTSEAVRIASPVFTDIGLRDYGDARNIMPKEEIYTWWKKIKSGKRSFSFKGQAVEYRFKPDGTWDTIPIANPPDDAVQVPAIPNQKQDKKAVSQELNIRSWPWLVIVAVSVGVMFVSLLLWKKKARA